MSKRSLKIKLPSETAQELAKVAEATQRSTGFIALRALSAAPKAPAVTVAKAVAFELTLDEDDAANTFAKITATSGDRSVDEALAAAWVATRDRFSKFLSKETTAREAEQADELDDSLREAAAPSTTAARLDELSASAYPRVRALVAAHPNTTAKALAQLSRDKEPYVRDAVENRTLKRGRADG
jgi:hypothetical protein